MDKGDLLVWIDEMGTTQAGAARLLGVSRATIRNWLAGKRQDGKPAPIPAMVGLACRCLYHRLHPWPAKG